MGAMGLAAPATADAHAIGTVTYQSPVPLWLYVIAGAVAVAASVPVAALADTRIGRNLGPNLYRPGSGRLVRVAQIVTAALLVEIVARGPLRLRGVRGNPATVLIWVDLWVGPRPGLGDLRPRLGSGESPPPLRRPRRPGEPSAAARLPGGARPVARGRGARSLRLDGASLARREPPVRPGTRDRALCARADRRHGAGRRRRVARAGGAVHDVQPAHGPRLAVRVVRRLGTALPGRPARPRRGRRVRGVLAAGGARRARHPLARLHVGRMARSPAPARRRGDDRRPPVDRALRRLRRDDAVHGSGAVDPPPLGVASRHGPSDAHDDRLRRPAGRDLRGRGGRGRTSAGAASATPSTGTPPRSCRSSRSTSRRTTCSTS